MSDVSERETLQHELTNLISEITDGNLTGEIISGDTDFAETGMNSVEYLEFIDRVENKFDVVIDLESDWSLTSIDKFVELLSDRSQATR
ncbi:acyl carrier protein [Mycobacterium sp. MUNTM1]